MMDCPCREVTEAKTIWLSQQPSPGSIAIPVAVTRPVETWLWSCSDDPCDDPCYDECPDCETIVQTLYASDVATAGARPFTVYLKRLVCRDEMDAAPTTCHDVLQALMRSDILKR